MNFQNETNKMSKEEIIKIIEKHQIGKLNNEPKLKKELLINYYVQYSDLDFCCCLTKIKETYNNLPFNNKISFSNFKILLKPIKHSNCGGEIILLYYKQILKICIKCKCELNDIQDKENNIECQNCFRKFYPNYNENQLIFKILTTNIYNLQLSECTYQYYHCGLLLDEKLKCRSCENNLFYSPNFDMILCKNCLYISNNIESEYICKHCNKKFYTKAKIYDVDEKYIINQVKKLSLKSKIKVKPSFLTGKPINDKCGCLINYKEYTHNSKNKCNGILYKGELDEMIYIICGDCEFTSLEKWMNWHCPKCGLQFTYEDFHTKIRKDDERIKNDPPIKKSNQIKLLHSNNDLEISRNPKKLMSGLLQKSKFFISEKEIEPTRITNKKNSYNSFNYLNTDNNYLNVDSNQITNITNKTDKTRLEEIREEKDFTSPNKGIKEKNIFSPIYNFSNSKINIISKDLPLDNNKTLYSNNVLKRNSNSLFTNLNLNLNKQEKIINENETINNNYSTINNNFNINLQIEDNKNTKNERKRGISLSSNRYFCSNEKNININIKIEGLNENQKSRYTTTQIYKTKDDNSQINPNINNNIINIKNFKIIKEVGKGSFANIYQVEENISGKIYALKKIIGNQKEDFKSINFEFELLSNLKNENIIKIYGITSLKLDNTTYVLYILMDFGLSDWYTEIVNRISNKNYYKEKEVWSIILQLVNVFSLLQKKNLAHRDIKPQNILIFKENKFKICDFGEAKKINYEVTSQETVRGSELYMSPLLFNALKKKQKKIGHNCYKSDVFSLGMSLLLGISLNFEILCEIRKKEDDSIKKIIEKELSSIGYSKLLIEFLYLMLNVNEENRLDFIQLEDNIKKIKYK